MNMQNDIRTMDDVKAFIEQIAQEISNFSPYDDFKNYVYPQSFIRRYTDEEAEIRNKTLDKCFQVCEVHTDDFLEYLEWFFELKRRCMMVEQV